MTYYLGVDPGKQGALALLSVETGTVNCIDMPDTTAALHDAIAAFPVIKGAMVEKPFYPQMIGLTNATKIAMAYGVLIGALQWRDIPFREVPPKKWKAAMDLSSSKSASREKAAQTFPAQSDLFKRVKDDGRAEAALLALYAADNRRRWAA
jgi:Holliday junction resolvasome RuvABC endonuclease subunit